MDTPYLKSYYRRGSTFLSSEQIETIRMLKGKVPKYRIIRDFHIHENRIDDIWENCERQQQVIQSTISSEILPMPTILSENSNRIESEVLLQSRSLSDELEIRGSASSLNYNSSNLHLEYDILPNKEIKKKSSKPRTKSVRISDPIPTSHIVSATDNNSIAEQWFSEPTEEICSDDLVALRKREAKIDEKNKRNLTRLLAT
ncbi:hypothetical protein Glove_661g42 [Diversispora epigaea]|uniref:Uncharacterized protein n=1 Tax=Diversispora epigaea TaxID=1348612 RepID=A0A397GC84_9GLOM|nr:hypothetical protein Glove_661g42 [Diversispora epigaea]